MVNKIKIFGTVIFSFLSSIRKLWG